ANPGFIGMLGRGRVNAFGAVTAALIDVVNFAQDADLTGDGRADLVGFGDAGVWTSLNNGDGTFQPPQFMVANFGFAAGGWRVERHPRFLADLTGDGRADIVGFGDAGVWVALNNGDGTFQAPQFMVANFGFEAGGWRVERHPRFLDDLTGDGRADIVGFGDAGVWVALNNGDGTFQAPQMVVANFAAVAGGWRVHQHPRFLADLTGDRRADIVGFGDAGVWVSLNSGNATFQGLQMVVANFAINAGGWRSLRHPRFIADRRRVARRGRGRAAGRVPVAINERAPR
ncbi:MAG: VCBS repeat-containing protein, partial [Chloroflexia bacterium]|nr:VCBS repeat-containing protein [Chloroflexia bacterium]